MTSVAMKPYLVLMMGPILLQSQGAVSINSHHPITLMGSGAAPPNVPMSPRLLQAKPAGDGFSIRTRSLLASTSATTLCFLIDILT